MTQMTRLQIVAKMNRIRELGKALEAEIEDGKPFGLGREFSVATTNLQTALLWSLMGLNGALQGAPE